MPSSDRPCRHQEKVDGRELGAAYGKVLRHGFLFKHSGFYSKARASSKAWQKRWTVLDEERFLYSRKGGKDRLILTTADDWAQSQILQISYTEFKVDTPAGSYTFKGSTPQVARQWTRQLKAQVAKYQALSPTERAAMSNGQVRAACHPAGRAA